jgi:anti-sigma factor RsiW
MRRLWDYLDDELTSERMAEVRRHLDECVHCVPHADWARTFLAALAATRAAATRPATGGGTRERVLLALRQAGYSG